MRGRAAWHRTLEARERYLAAGDPDRLPARAGEVRREIALSWRRSLLSGVDTASTDLPCDPSAVPPERLVRAARPLIDWLSDQLAGMPVWAFLADRECRLVSYVVGDPALTPQLEARGAFPGARFAEDVVGTNGLGTAGERQRPFIVAGSEHYRAYESLATTAGAPVRDPVTRRLVGLLNINCPYELTNGLLLPFVTELARSVEEQLLAHGSAAEKALLDEFVRVTRLCSAPTVALGPDVCIANTAALALLDGADYELLRHWAREAAAEGRERTARLHRSAEVVVTARCRPLEGAARSPSFAAVVILARSSATAARGAPPSAWERLAGQVEQAGAMRLPLLLRGERGTGKAVLARRLRDDAGPCAVFDAAAGGARPHDWTEPLRAALRDPGHGGLATPRRLGPGPGASDSGPAGGAARTVGGHGVRANRRARRPRRADRAVPRGPRRAAASRAARRDPRAGHRDHRGAAARATTPPVHPGGARGAGRRRVAGERPPASPGGGHGAGALDVLRHHRR